MTPKIDTLETALNLGENDAHLDVRGPLNLPFDRSYMNEKGYHRAEYTNTSLPWSNNIGSGWTHRYNVHLRTSVGSPPTAVEFFDHVGTGRTFLLASTSGGFNWYYRSASGTTAERGEVLKRNTSTGAYTLERVRGATYPFSAATADAHGCCHIASITDKKGVTTGLDWSYALYGGGLKTYYDRSALASVCAITEFDGSASLRKVPISHVQPPWDRRAFAFRHGRKLIPALPDSERYISRSTRTTSMGGC